MPIPRPVISREDIIASDDEAIERVAKLMKLIAKISMPLTHNHLVPILSDKVPEIGAIKAIIRGTDIKYKPASEVAMPRSLIR